MSKSKIGWTEDTYSVYSGQTENGPSIGGSQMAQTKSGALKISAHRAGVSVKQYVWRCAKGEKWCYSCKRWHPATAFGKDSTRHDGRSGLCLAARRSKAKELYAPVPRPPKGRSYVSFRDGDAKQARRRINYLVEEGILPSPSSLPCSDCGQTWEEGLSRHEYDHHLGYAAARHEDVEAVCASCHHKRPRSH